jgi:lysophospholipase L1-like esterase
MDGWKDLIGVKSQNRDEDVTSLRHVTSTDNVHFTREGYENLVAAIHATINTRRCVSAAR